ncbi:MAG: albusnodin family lasso peptide [Pseudonocardiaceae bacterium]
MGARPATRQGRSSLRHLTKHDEPIEACEDPELVIDLGDAADLTLGSGNSTQEGKRHIYN